MVPVARALMTQTMGVVRYFKVQLLSLDAGILCRHLQTLDLQTEGIRAGDGFHIATAADFNAELLVSTDSGVLALDRLISNCRGTTMGCLDSDEALQLL